MKTDVLTLDGGKNGSVDLDDEIFEIFPTDVQDIENPPQGAAFKKVSTTVSMISVTT